uniref:Uncharacterized protein n=1 Tax=Avena sativa TaxID=4498 RepID=A0ACD5UGW2_AVESA
MVTSSHTMVSPGMRRDRITDLPDDVLGHVLSFLPTAEAGRAAALCRRWRYIFGHVHTVWYEEREGDGSSDWGSFYFEANKFRTCRNALLTGISGALLCRRRCAGTHVPLRSVRLAFDDFKPAWDALHVDRWLNYVLQNSDRELQLDLRFRLGPICAGDRYRFANDNDDDTDSDSDDDDDHQTGSGLYLLPRRLFSCAALKTLSLGHCRLKLPAEVNLPFLETLRLTGILNDSGRSVQRLVLSCPRLADLTLEAVRHLRTLFVLHRPLRHFALRCCHTAKSVHVDASELLSLEYRGAVPADSLLTLHGSPPHQYSCTFHFCMLSCGRVMD